MMGYDTLLSSYYDHYILDYHEFEAWKFNYNVLDIPTGIWVLGHLPSIRESNLSNDDGDGNGNENATKQ